MAATGTKPKKSESGASPYLKDPEVQLMLRARDGDDDAYTQLVGRYQDRLISIFTHMVNDRSVAEDLAQEVFLRIYRARHGYTPDARFSTWVFRIASNLASNTRRSKGRRKEVQLAGDSGPLGARPQEQLAVDESGMRPSRQFARNEMQQIVQDAMATLNERQRMALLFHKFEGMSYKQIGEAMEMSPAAVKSLLSRARENLRVKLEPYVK